MRRFSSKKLAKLLARLGKREAWLASETGRAENTIRNWLGGKKPDLDSYLDLVDALKRNGIDEAEILAETR